MLGRLLQRSCFAAALLGLAGCFDQLPPAPEIDAVHPRAAFEGNATVLTVVGRFPPAVYASYRDPQSSGLDTRYSLMLRDVQLPDVQYAEGTTLTAVAPSDLAPGIYDVVAIDPTNRQTSLPGGFVVLPLSDRPTALSLFPVPGSASVSSCSKKLTVESVNDLGQARTVADTLPVSVTVTPPGAVELFEDSGCLTPLGSLALTYPDSKVSLYFRPLLPVRVTLTFSAEGLASASHQVTVTAQRSPPEAGLRSAEVP